MAFGRLSLAFVAALGTVPARAEVAPTTEGVRLSFVRAENASDCVAPALLEREIARRMGRNPFAGSPRQWIEGFVRQADGGAYEVELLERDAQGRTLGARRLREAGGNCRKLDDAIELAIALIIDPSAQLLPPRPELAADDASSIARARESARARHDDTDASAPAPDGSRHRAETSGEERAELRPAPRRPETPRASSLDRDDTNPKPPGPTTRGVTVAGDSVVVAGVLPRAAVGVELGTRIALTRRSPWEVKLSSLFLPEQTDATQKGRFGYGLTAFELGMCARSRGRRIYWYGCADLGLGAIHAVVHDPEPFEPGDRLWFAGRLEAAMSARILGPVWVQVRTFDLIAPNRWDFRVQTASAARSVFKQHAWMPGAALGLALQFD